jgi:hypothetical protein
VAVVLAEKLLSMAIAVVAAEEAAREVARALAPARGVARPRSVRVVRLVDPRPGAILSESGPGRLDELVVISDSGNYELSVTADDVAVSSGPFSWYRSVSEYVEWIDAFEDNGTFVLRVSDIPFSRSLSVYFAPTAQSPVRVREVLAKIEKW